MDKILIIDNFFTEEKINKIVHYFEEVNWQCKCAIRPNVSLETDIPFWRHELLEVSLFKDELREEIEKKMNKLYHVKRVYSVGQTYEQNSNFHIDDDEENTYTLCLYINPMIKDDDEGYFYLKVPNETHTLAINPIFNRGVFFPGNYRHKGTGTIEYFRICVAWKLKEIIKTN
jgi:hypothetical protein